MKRGDAWKVRGRLSRRTGLVIGALTLAVMLGLWWLLAASGWVNPLFLPTPERVIARLASWWNDGLMEDVGISVYRVTAAFGLAALLAVPLGLMAGSFAPVQAALQPLMEFSRYLPAVAFVPLVLLWVGIDEGSKITIIWIGTFFQMVLMVTDDVRRVPQTQLDAALTLGADRRELMSLVMLKSALPDIVNTLRVTMGWAWTYLVVAELVAANSGLGYSILKAQRFLQTETIFAGILLIGVLGLAMDQLFRLLHRMLFPWINLRRS